MISATIEDRKLIVILLAKSFINNQSVNFIVRQDNQKLKRINALMEYAFDMCSLFGDVLLSNNRNACALILYPHLKKATGSAIWLDMQLIFKTLGIGGIAKVLKREAQIKNIQPKGKMAYLWFIGVDPLMQHFGIGSQLLREVIETTAIENLPLYLETSTLANLPWYERFGFEIYHQLDLGYALYFLKRLPKKN